jgi:hypothetical protein
MEKHRPRPEPRNTPGEQPRVIGYYPAIFSRWHLTCRFVFLQLLRSIAVDNLQNTGHPFWTGVIVALARRAAPEAAGATRPAPYCWEEAVDSTTLFAVLVFSLFLAAVLVCAWRATVLLVMFCTTFFIIFGVASLWVALHPA